VYIQPLSPRDFVPSLCQQRSCLSLSPASTRSGCAKVQRDRSTSWRSVLVLWDTKSSFVAKNKTLQQASANPCSSGWDRGRCDCSNRLLPNPASGCVFIISLDGALKWPVRYIMLISRDNPRRSRILPLESVSALGRAEANEERSSKAIPRTKIAHQNYEQGLNLH
jgi:RNA polymerase subunit RPABC4/transcription elongation factor Spt4